MLMFIKHFSLIIYMIYCYHKIMNFSIAKKHLLDNMIFSIITSACIAILSINFPYYTITILILFSFIYFLLHSNYSVETVLIATIISYCISYISFALSSMLIAILTHMLFSLSSYNHLIAQIMTAVVQFPITYLLFIPKRFRKGMPFLTNKIYGTTPMIISLLILYLFQISSTTAGSNPTYITILYIALLFVIYFYLYWRNSITRTYNDKRRDRDIDILTEHVEELEEEYKKLTEDKDELAKIVHRDNKLVPAMLLSVESFLTEFPDATPEMKARGQELMAELNKEAESRKGILKQQDQKCTAKLISTGIPYLDSVLTYMQEKAMSKDIVLSASGDPGIADLVARTIEEEDLKTLAADMLENAIIANTHNHGSNVYFVIGYFGKHLAIYVYDSGIPFTKEVLLDLGIQKHTTHEEDGGSGIGLMTIFELVRKYRATYIIDEYSTPTGPYTKRITIVFDKRRKYILNTSRPKEEIDFLRQRADLIIEARKEPHIK